MILKAHSDYIHILTSENAYVCLFQDYSSSTSRFQRGGYVEPPFVEEVLFDDNLFYSNLGFILWSCVNTINRAIDDKDFPEIPYKESMNIYQTIIKTFNNLRSLECFQLEGFIERCREEQKSSISHHKDINARMRIMLGPILSNYPKEEDKIRSYWKFFRSEPRKSRRFDEINIEFPRMLFESTYDEKYVKLYIKDLIEANIIAVTRKFVVTNPDIILLWTGGESLRNYITESIEYFTTDYDIKVIIKNKEELPSIVQKIEENFMVNLAKVLNENFGSFRIDQSGQMVMKRDLRRDLKIHEEDNGFVMGCRFKDGDHILNIVGFKYFKLPKVEGRDFLLRFNCLYSIDNEIRDIPFLDINIMESFDHANSVPPFFEIYKPEYETIALNDEERELIGKEPSKEDYHKLRRGRRLGYFAIPTSFRGSRWN